MPEPEISAPREPWLAAALSLLLPGLGQWYSGRKIRGILWAAGTIATLAGTIAWILSETDSSPWHGLAVYAVLLFCQFGSWIDAFLLTRRMFPRAGETSQGYRFRPELAAALSVFFPGLGQAYVLFRNRFVRILAGAFFAVPALAVMCGEILESWAIPGWPRWLADWPMYIAVPAWALVSGLSIAHAWWFAHLRNGDRPRLPRLPAAVAVVALLAWTNALVPWEVLAKTRVRTFQIPSESMLPTLRIGDRLWAKNTGEYSRGDIVVFKPPHDPSADFIKRVVGLPGETITVRGKIVRVNGKPVREPFAVWKGGGVKNFGPYRVPPGHLFLMGDNRDNSFDSRFFGPVALESVFGRAYKLYWPFARAVPLPRPAR